MSKRKSHVWEYFIINVIIKSISISIFQCNSKIDFDFIFQPITPSTRKLTLNKEIGTTLGTTINTYKQ